MFRTLVILLCFIVANKANADTVTGSADAFSGPNVYSPSVMYDYQENDYKMWYGGWQVADQRRDSIYYRVSGDGVNWPSNYAEVLTPDAVAQRYQELTGQAVSFTHVNDPSVSKHYNTSSETYQYTMFFTACLSPCNDGSQNSIWSVVSADGINWDFPTPLNVSLPSGVSGPQNPSIIIDDSDSSNVFWHVYFSVSYDKGNNVYLTYVDGTRNPVGSAFSVFNPNISVQNPNVMILGSTWYLVFNTGNGVGGYDIYYALSSNNDWSQAGIAPLIQNSGNPFCMADTPAALPLSGSEYLLYFATVQTDPNGVCNFSANQTISIRSLSQ